MYSFLALFIFLFKLPTILSECAKLSPPIGGHFVGHCGNSVGSVCIIQCGKNPHRRQRVCTPENHWTGGIILCPSKLCNCVEVDHFLLLLFTSFIFLCNFIGRKKKCRPLYAPENGYFVGDCKRLVGSICVFACNPGYVLHGDSELVCLSRSHRWSSSEPSCEKEKPDKDTCHVLDAPKNGARRGDCFEGAPIGSHCVFECSSGFDLHGASVLSCGPYGIWNGTAPTCEPKKEPPTCPSLTPPLFGHYNGECSPGKANHMCTYTCDKGYYLVGSPALLCQEDGTWSRSPPVCISKHI